MKTAKNNGLPKDTYKVLSPDIEILTTSDDKKIRLFVTRYGDYGLPYLFIKQGKMTIKMPLCDITEMQDLIHTVLRPETLIKVLEDIAENPTNKSLMEDWREIM